MTCPIDSKRVKTPSTGLAGASLGWNVSARAMIVCASSVFRGAQYIEPDVELARREALDVARKLAESRR